MAGTMGAHCAVLFFYLFGGAAFLWIIPLLFMIYIFLRGLSLYDQWERIIAVSCMVFVSSTLLATYMVDFLWSPYPGGIIGSSCANLLLYYGDYLGRILFLYTSLVVAFIVWWRFSSMACIYWLIDSTLLCINIIKQYRVFHRCALGLVFLGNMVIVRPLRFLFHFMQSLYDGT